MNSRNQIQKSYSPRGQYVKRHSSPKMQSSLLRNQTRRPYIPQLRTDSIYEEYYQHQTLNYTDSISGNGIVEKSLGHGSSYPSKSLRTENSKEKLSHLGIQSPKNQANAKDYKSPLQKGRNLKTQYSRDKLLSKLSSQDQNSIGAKNSINVTKNYDQSSGNMHSNYHHEESQTDNRYLVEHSSAEWPYTDNSQAVLEQTSSRQVGRRLQPRTQGTVNAQGVGQPRSRGREFQSRQPPQLDHSHNGVSSYRAQQPSSSRYYTSARDQGESNGASTVTKTGGIKSESSLSIGRYRSGGKLKRPKMATFYQAEAKNYYRYNDEGYLTNTQLQLMQKVEREAQGVYERCLLEKENILEESEEPKQSRLLKSKSAGEFKYLQRLKDVVEKQRQEYYELYGQYEVVPVADAKSKQGAKSRFNPKTNPLSNPSSLPPTSSLSKLDKNLKKNRPSGNQTESARERSNSKNFKVKYKEEENLLQKHGINDSYHDREDKKRKKHKEEIRENARSSIISEGKSKKSKISSKSHKRDEKAVDGINSSVPAQPQGQSKVSVEQHFNQEEMLSSKKSLKQPAFESNSHFLQVNGSQNVANQSQKSSSNLLSSHVEQQSINQSESNNYQSGSQIRGQYTHSAEEQSSKSSKFISSKLKINSNQNFDMINSNYKRAEENQEKFSGNGVQQSSLKLQTNREKGKNVGHIFEKDRNDQPFANSPEQGGLFKQNQPEEEKSSLRASQIESIGSAKKANEGQGIESVSSDSNQFFRKNTSHSIKSSHLGLAKLQIESSSSKNLSKKSSLSGSGSVIETSLNKKQSSRNQKWIRQSHEGSNLDQKVSISMAKNHQRESEPYEATQRVYKDPQQNDYRTLEIDSNRKLKGESQSESKLSFKSNLLNLNSNIKVEDPLPSKKAVVSAHNNEVIHEDSKNELSSLARNSKGTRSKNSHRNSQSSNSVRESTVVMSSGSKISKISLRETPLSTPNSKEQPQSGSKHSISSKQLDVLPDKSQPRQSGSRLSSSTEQFSAQSDSEGFSESEGFFTALYEKAHELIDYEEELHERRKEAEAKQTSRSEDLEEVVSKVESHIAILREILDVAITATSIYSDDSYWVYKSCFLSIKKYYLERVKLVEALRGNKSCFVISENELSEGDIRPHLQSFSVRQLTADMHQCNELTFKLIEDFHQYLQDMSSISLDRPEDFNLRLFDDRFELGVLLEEYYNEIVGLREKGSGRQSGSASQSRMSSASSESSSEDTEQIIQARIFKLMETGFLMAELANKKIKPFEEDFEEDAFEEYFSDNWAHFERVVKTLT